MQIRIKTGTSGFRDRGGHHLGRRAASCFDTANQRDVTVVPCTPRVIYSSTRSYHPTFCMEEASPVYRIIDMSVGGSIPEDRTRIVDTRTILIN